MAGLGPPPGGAPPPPPFLQQAPLIGPAVPGGGAAVAYPAIGQAGAPLATPLVNIAGAIGPGGGGIAPAVTALPGLPLADPVAGADLAAIGLPAVGQPGGPAALNGSFPNGMDAWAAAMSNARLGASTIQNSNVIAEKANEMRRLFLARAQEIYQRLVTIRQTAAPLQAQAQAAGQARAALIELINAVNDQGYIDPNQAAALHDLANELNNLDIQGIINALIGEINQLGDAVGLVQQAANPAGFPANANDQAANPLAGGRRKRKKGKKTRRKKKKHKGGFKYSRIANSRRSLRMTRRKSLRHKKHHKKHNKKHKRTKKHRRRKRR